MVTKRKPVERTEDGRFKNKIAGMDEFAAEVAMNLISKFPDIDYFDLKYQFDAQLALQYTMLIMKGEQK